MALPCNGVLEDNIQIAAALGEIAPEGAERLARAMALTGVDLRDGPDFAESIATRDSLLALA